MEIVYFLGIGLVAGWLAGIIMKGRGLGVLGNLVIGILGSVAGGMLFNLLGIDIGGNAGALVTALVGAIVLLFVISLFTKQ